jgi:hypothetical protein
VTAAVLAARLFIFERINCGLSSRDTGVALRDRRDGLPSLIDQSKNLSVIAKRVQVARVSGDLNNGPCHAISLGPKCAHLSVCPEITVSTKYFSRIDFRHADEVAQRLTFYRHPADIRRHVSHTGTERAGCHRFFGRGTYGLHCKGLTASGVPLPELTQPAAVSLNGLWSSYGSPRRSRTTQNHRSVNLREPALSCLSDGTLNSPCDERYRSPTR